MVFLKTKLLYIIIFLILFQFVSGDHFRYGSLQWISNSPSTNDFKLKVAFSLSYLNSKGIYPTPGYTYIYAESRIDFDNLNYPLEYEYFDDLTYLVTAVHPQKDLVLCDYSVTLISNYRYQPYYTYWYANNGVRQSNLLNNAGQTFRVTTNTTYTATPGIRSSPNCGIYPIIDMFQGRVNTYQLISIDTNRPINQLVYTLSPGTAMSTDGASLVQPPGLTVSSSGLITFTPPSIGLYNVGIRVNDYLDYTWCSLDFLINSRSYPTTAFPYFQSPTPAAGSLNTFSTGISNTLTLSAISPVSTATVSILVSDAPSSMIIGAQIGSNPATIQLTWNPLTTSVGYHIISMSLIDSFGVSIAGSYSFIIQVVASSCGQGYSVCSSPNNCYCSCYTGWIGPTCSSCASNTYGQNCMVADECFHGTSSTGPGGNGECLCNQGWTGRYCNESIITTCSLTTSSYIIGTTVGSLVTPTIIQAYLSPTVNPQLSIPLTIPTTPNSINLLILLDETSSSSLSTRYQQIKSSYQTLYNSLNRASLTYGLAKFSDSSSVIDPLTMVTGFKNDLFVEMAGLSLVAGDPQAGYPYRAIAKAAQTAPWTANSVRIIILITDNNIAPSQSDFDSAANQLISNNVLFGVLGVDTVDSYTPLLNRIGYGRSAAWNTVVSWTTTFADSIFIPLTKDVSIIKILDSNGFVVTVPSNSTTGVSQFSSIIAIPTDGSIVTNPVVQYQIIGYGYQTINIQFNHPPTTSPITITTFQNAAATNFQIQAYDSDLNVLTTTFPQLPTLGILSTSSGSIIINKPYPINTTFIYTPIPNKYGDESFSFVVSDGCSVASSLVSISMSKVNTIPTCSDIPVTTSQTSNSSFVVQGGDLDNDPLTIKFPSINGISLLGTLYIFNIQATSLLVEGQTYVSPLSLLFVPISSASSGSVSLQYLVSDQVISTQCKVTVTLIRSNLPPLIQIQSSITTLPTTSKVIPFIISDLDSQENLTASITSTTPAGGKFYDFNNIEISSTPYPLGTFDSTSESYVNSNITFVAPNSSPATASFTLYVVDSHGLSTTQNVTISVVGSRPNSAPVATSIPPFYINQGSETPLFYLNGTDQNEEDKILTVVINSLPTFGQLLSSNGSVSTASGSTPMQIKYKPNPTFYGTDQLIFNVQDTLGASGVLPISVYFYVAHVNHPPTASAPNIYINQYQNSSEINIVANDYDLDTLTGIMISLPQYGSLEQSDGTTIPSANTIITDPNLNIIYIPPVNFYSSFNTSYTVKICDNYSIPACVQVSGNISYTYFNTPPSSYDVTFNCTQGQYITIDLNCTDIEGTPSARFTTLPTHGNISFTNGTIINSISTLVPLTLVYTPDPKQSDNQTPGGLGPLERFFYVAHDALGIESITSVINIYVLPALPPIYTGPIEFNVNEDSNLTIPIKATPGSNGNINMNLLSFNGKGGKLLLYSSLTYSTLSIFPTIISFNDPETVLIFSPFADYNGNDINISFNLFDGSSISDDIIIQIEVTPTNDIPVLVPISYTNDNKNINYTNQISINVNTTSVISWNDNDIDSPDNDVYGIVVKVPKNGNLYTYDFSNPNFIGKTISDGDHIGRDIDGLFKVVFQGVDGVFAVNYTDFQIAVNDGYNSSIPARIYIDIKPINTPPNILVNNHYFETLPNKKLSIKGISINDADAAISGAKISLNIKITGSNLKTNDYISIPTVTNCSVNYNSIQCESPQTNINSNLESLIVFIQNVGNYTISIVVNDLGLDFPGVQPLSSQSQIVVNVKVPTNPNSEIINDSKPKKNLALMIPLIIIGCLLVLLVIGFLVYKYIKRKRTITPPPSSAAFATGFNISSNPMYKTATNTMKNNKKLRQSLANIN